VLIDYFRRGRVQYLYRTIPPPPDCQNPRNPPGQRVTSRRKNNNFEFREIYSGIGGGGGGGCECTGDQVFRATDRIIIGYGTGLSGTVGRKLAVYGTVTDRARIG